MPSVTVRVMAYSGVSNSVSEIMLCRFSSYANM